MPLVGLTMIFFVLLLLITGYNLIPNSPARNILLFPIAVLVVILSTLIILPYLFGTVFGAKKLGNPKLEAFTEVERRFGLRSGQVWIIPSNNQVIAILSGICGLNARIFLHEGLFNNRLFTKKERQAVFAHELAHVQKRHRLKKFVLVLVPIAIILAIKDFVDRTMPGLNSLSMTVIIDIAGYILLALVLMYFSRKFEFEADLTAAQMGYQKGLISFFDKLDYGNTQIHKLSRISCFVASHPDRMDRRDHLLKNLKRTSFHSPIKEAVTSKGLDQETLRKNC